MPKKPHITDVDFLTRFKSDYYDYGMNVIEDRALPDVRDGLKPVNRAILTEMLTSHITSKNKTVKVAKITGAVIGKWHPHGDSAVEDALSGMAATWKNSMPVIDVKGNNGSVYGDRHAAGRYIEARLSPTGDAYGKNLNPGIVPYTSNFDETAMMPVIMPAQLPYLLINGGEGIAVGVASSLPTHNPIEVIKAFISYTKDPKQSIESLMEILPGPDFPTKGEIINKRDLPEIYKTGLGRIRVRGRVRYEKKNHSLHIYEIPFTASGSMNNLVDEITLASMESVDKKGKRTAPKIAGIVDVKDHSGKNGIDITIMLKRGVDGNSMIKELYAKTRLETTLKFDFSALNRRKLKRYNLKSYFKEYLAFQHNIVINEYTNQKKQLETRLEIIKGLLILQTVIDEVISSARNANGKAELREVLMNGKIVDGVPKKYHKTIKAFKFSELQAEHIANLPIYKINKMDYASLIDEGKDIQKKLLYADTIIQSTTKRKNLIVRRHEHELDNLSASQFTRQTDIIDDEISVVSKLEIPETPLYVSMDKYQYLRIEEKKFENAIQTSNKSRLGFIGSNGICWNLHLENIKPTTNNGVLITQLIASDSRIIGWSTHITDDDEAYGLFIFKDGNMKLTDMRKYMTKTKSTKVSGGKSDIPLVKYLDVPNNAVGFKLNGETYALSDMSMNGLSGHGKHMTNEFSDDDDIIVEFITDEKALPATKSKRKSAIKSTTVANGVAYFDGGDSVSFDWTENEPSKDALFAIPYQELLKSKILFVHADGRAKIVDGKQFKVSTKRTSIQADKKGSKSIYIGFVPETLVGHYKDDVTKRVKTADISTQGKSGGGIRTFYTAKHEFVSVEDGQNSDLECVSLATQPK